MLFLSLLVTIMIIMTTSVTFMFEVPVLLSLLMGLLLFVVHVWSNMTTMACGRFTCKVGPAFASSHQRVP